MSKTSVFTSCTPLPSGITRQGVLDTFHNHVEMIKLNPLVVECFECKPPIYSPEEENVSTWYTIKDKVNYLPGGLASGSVSYHACFHNLPDGLQTHVYAPLGLDIRAKWSVGGSLPGEPKEPVELGIKAPAKGLYVREDVRMKCNVLMMGFVKKTFKDSHSKLVDRLVEKSHLLESESANKRLNMLKEVAPGERMGHGSIFIAPPPGYQEFGADGQEQKLHPHLGHESMGSNDSNLSEPHSAGLSQASTFTSPSSHLSSPPQSHRQPHHQHSHSQDSNYKGPFQFAPAPALQEPVSEEQDQLSQLSYLPSTTYNPHAQETSTPETHKKAAATYSLLPAVAYNPRPQLRARAKTESQTPQLQVHELPAQGPPVPPKNEHIAELPA